MLPTKFRFIWLGSFRGEDFLDIDQSETRIACGSHVPCLLIDRDEMSDLHRGHSIDASHQEDLKKSANQKQKLPVVAMFGNGSKQNVHSLERSFHRCFLPSFSSIWLRVFRGED